MQVKTLLVLTYFFFFGTLTSFCFYTWHYISEEWESEKRNRAYVEEIKHLLLESTGRTCSWRDQGKLNTKLCTQIKPGWAAGVPSGAELGVLHTKPQQLSTHGSAFEVSHLPIYYLQKRSFRSWKKTTRTVLYANRIEDTSRAGPELWNHMSKHTEAPSAPLGRQKRTKYPPESRAWPKYNPKYNPP